MTDANGGYAAAPQQKYEAFLRGDRPDDVLVYLHDEGVGSPDSLREVGHSVTDGVVLVLPGEAGRSAFSRVSGLDVMEFASTAMQTDGDVDDGCTGGSCPKASQNADVDHYVTFVFAFAEQRNDDVGGVYAEGDVIHGYAACSCGTSFSDRWVIET